MNLFKKILEWVFDFAMYLNIVMLLPQPVQIWQSKSSENVSVWMWLAFFVFQAAVSLHGKLNLRSTPMFYGMGISAIVSLVTMILCLMYK